MFKVKLFNIFIIIFSLLLGACNPTKDSIFAPKSRLFKQMPDGPPDYQQGWLDGCETGLSTGFANDYYKTFYKYNKDKEMVIDNNTYYLNGWSSAMIFCRHVAVSTLREAGMTPKASGQGYPLRLEDASIFGNPMAPNKWGAQGLKHW